jgi:putative endonuclease
MGPHVACTGRVGKSRHHLFRHASEGWHPCRLRAKLRYMKKGGWVYVMTNAPYGTLYIGVTAELPARIAQHRSGEGSEFCRRHGLTRLVYCEHYERIEDAITREKAMKAWKRQWKIRRIEEINPQWKDLFDHLLEASF